jgi:outer membrane receptor protein involved in Fe transport
MGARMNEGDRAGGSTARGAGVAFGLVLALLGSQASASAIEEIVVSARAVEQSVRDVPVAITAFNEEVMDNMALTSFDDIAAYTPSVDIARLSSGSGTSISIRGISSSSGSLGIEQSVAVVIDGVYYPQGRSINEGLFDTSQVAILKGPQALYFGKNATAGVISVMTNDPGDELEVLGKIGYETEFKTTRAEGVLSFPINDRWGARLALQGTKMSDGWLENTAPDTVYTTLDAANGFAPTDNANPAPKDSWNPGEESWHGRLTLKGELSDVATLRLKGSYSDFEYNTMTLSEQYECSALNGTPHITRNGDFDPVTGWQRPTPLDLGECEPNRARGLNPIPPAVAATSKDLNRFGGELGEDYESYSFTADLELDLENVFIKTFLNYHDQTVGWVIDADNNEVTSIFASENNQFENFSFETRAATQFGGPVNAVLGFYYQSTDRKFRQEVIFAGAENSAADPSNRFIAYDKISETDGETVSGYGELIWDLSEQWQLTAGARYIWENKDSFFTQPYVNPAFLGLFVEGTLEDDRSFDDFIPEVTIRYQPNDDVTIYAAYKQGFKSGGFDNGAIYSTLNPDPVGDITFEPETVEGVEGGIKASLFEGTVSVELDAYYYEYTDLQLNFFNSSVFAYRTLNAGAAETLGGELQVQWAPPAVDGLTLLAAVAYNDASYKDFIAPCSGGQSFSGGCTIGTPPVPFGPPTLMDQNLKGEPRNLAPEWSGIVGFDFTRGIGNGLQIGLTGNMQWKTDYSLSEFIPSAEQDGYVWIDAAVRFGAESGRWQLAFIGKNLSDEYVLVSARDTAQTGGNTGTDFAYPADRIGTALRPRTFEMELSVRF